MTLCNREGQEIRCAITDFRDGDVLLKREDGMAFRYPLEDLDEASQQQIRQRISRRHPPRVEVKPVRSSNRETKSYDIFGSEHRQGTKERVFSIELRTFCPFETPVVVECFFYKGSTMARETYRGMVAYGRDWSFEVGGNTRWHAIDFSGGGLGRSTDYFNGSRQLELAVLVTDEQGKIYCDYCTSRVALDLATRQLANRANR